MRIVAAVVLFISLCSFADWKTNLAEAREEAASRHKYILLNFSGSDWCGPCMKMKQSIFESDVFKKFADQTLVLVNADFPRQKKNQLSIDQQRQNNALADQYDREGLFPLTVLLDEKGKIVKEWRGYPGISAESFVVSLKGYTDAGR